MSYKLDPKTTENYFNQSIKAPMLQAFDREIMPRLNQNFASAGATFSTRKLDATRTALSDLTSNLSSARADLAYKDQSLAAQLAESAAGRRMNLNQMNAGYTDAAQNRMMSAIGLQSSLANQPLQQAGMISSLLQPWQQRQDLGAQAQYQEFLRTAPENSPYLQQALQFMGQQHTAQYTQPGWGGIAAGVLGGAMTGFLPGSAGILGGGLLGGLGAARF